MSLNKAAAEQELLCINTEKVYDWVLNEASFDVNINDLELPINTVTGDQLECDDIDQSTVTCRVSPATVDPIVVLNREDQVFVVDGEEVILQFVNIRKNFDVTVFVSLIPELGGGTIEVGTASFTRCEQVILCAPEGTDINVSYTDLDCFVCSVTCDPGTTTEIDELNVMVTVRSCQSIQATYGVTLELAAAFCQPRDILPIPPCPAPTIPAQCPVIFPNTVAPEPEPEKQVTPEMLHTNQEPTYTSYIEEGPDETEF